MQVNMRGQSFKDRANSPQMVVVPMGCFMMGSDKGDSDEKPVHQVNINYPLAVSKYLITFAQWDACVANGGCGGYSPNDAGWGRDNRPVINVSWQYAQAYVQWLRDQTGHHYRLLTEAEWEYAARAGTNTEYPWGNNIIAHQANGLDLDSQWSNQQTSPVGSFAPNAFGLYDMHGNVWEWVEDCWHNNYQDAPTNGSAWLANFAPKRVVRGGSWLSQPCFMRSAFRGAESPLQRSTATGFRVARSL